MHSYPYVGCFSGHLKKILGLAIHPKEQLLLSASEDSTIRLWRIETFNETYRFDIMDSIETMTLVNPKNTVLLFKKVPLYTRLKHVSFSFHTYWIKNKKYDSYTHGV